MRFAFEKGLKIGGIPPGLKKVEFLSALTASLYHV